MPPNGPARSTRVDGSTGGQTFTSVEPVTGRRRRRCGGSGGRATSRAARQRCAATLGADAVRHSSYCAAPCGCSRLDCSSGCTWSWAATPHWLCWRMPILSRRSRPAASAPSTTRAGVMAANRHLVAAPLVEEYTTPISRKSSGPSRPSSLSKTSTKRHNSRPKPATGLSLAIQTTDIVSGAQKSVDLLENLVETADLYGARRLAATCPSSGPCTRSYVTRARQYPGRDASSC